MVVWLQVLGEDLHIYIFTHAADTDTPIDGAVLQVLCEHVHMLQTHT